MPVDSPSDERANVNAASSNHRVDLIEGVLLEAAVRCHPVRLTVRELTSQIVANPEDHKEIWAIGKAIGRLRRCGLFRYRRREGTMEPTPAALRAVELLTR